MYALQRPPTPYSSGDVYINFTEQNNSEKLSTEQKNLLGFEDQAQHAEQRTEQVALGILDGGYDHVD